MKVFQIESHLERARVCLEDGDLAAAIRECDAAVEAGRPEAVALYLQALDHESNGRAAEAWDACAQAVRIDLEVARALCDCGALRHLAGDFDGAIAALTEASKLDPNSARVYYNRGIARHVRGDIDGAIEDFDTAIRLDPEDPVPWWNRGAAKQARRDWPGAI